MKLKQIRKEIASLNQAGIKNILTAIIDKMEEAGAFGYSEDMVSKAEVQETLSEVKDKVEDLMDDGKLNQSNKTGKKAKGKK